MIWRFLFFFGLFFWHSCSDNPLINSAGVFEDSRDGQKYPLLKIGEKVWMNENLRYNSDSTFCYDNSESNCEKLGKLYTWAQANQACPDGWRLPSMQEWQDLMTVVESEDWMKNEHGSKRLYEKFKNNYAGLDFPLAGFYTPWNGHFNFIDTMGSYWSSEKFGFEAAMCVTFNNTGDGFVMFSPGTRYANHTCRCIQE